MAFIPIAKETHVATTHSRSTGKSSGTTAKKGTARGRHHALALLEKDHREVERLFSKFEKAKEDAEKAELARQICMELKVHTRIEEEMLYPMAREETGEDDLVDEAKVEHDTAKMLIKDIESGKPSDDLFDARVSVLGEYIKHHVKEEEGELFPAIEKKADLDLDQLGEKLMQRKQALMEKMGKGDGKA